MFKAKQSNQAGSIIVSILIVTMFLTVLISALLVIANATLVRARSRVLILQAQYSAESGADAVVAQLNSGNESYSGSGGEVTVLTSTLYRATFSTTVAAGSSGREKIITSTGRVYAPASSATAKYSRKIEVITQRTSNSVIASGIISRNIIEIASSVKDIYARDIYVNGYLQTDKNTNVLHSETITAAGKNTGATNCSISGPGNLTKPTSFTNPAQTKTIITTAYNNCIVPPGNNSNSDFTVATNQNNINKIQSTYIPWSQFMDNSYQSAGSCNDWTSGGTTRSIPSAGNTKKTHYPDSASNISSSCGSSGNLDLGNNITYNITDNVHIRANLCATNGCNPTFNNPDANSPKYIFVEGTINFVGVTSVPGSGPIVLASYGADPVNLASACPLGGAIYLGSSGNFVVNAPQIYFLSTNGLCFDKTKFSGTAPKYYSFGGLSGKNIYISTNSGTPHDPTLSIDFPLEFVPIDLTWHATRYRRL